MKFYINSALVFFEISKMLVLVFHLRKSVHDIGSKSKLCSIKGKNLDSGISYCFI